MSALGCESVTELDEKAKAIFEKHGVTQEDINKFRQNLKKEHIKEIADKIVAKVTECRKAPEALGAAPAKKEKS
jgi:arsenate reductase-like glutaredoxin family protein